MKLGDKDTAQKILELKKQKNAVILAHYYQNAEIQDIADYVGDSLGLSMKSVSLKSDVIVFCGVKFMAESAKILNPDRTVLLATWDALCPMADMIDKDDVLLLKKQYPAAAVVCYVNTSADVKAVSDICCTSSNAVNIVNSLPNKDIIFIPDENLGNYVAKNVQNKNIILFKGYCITHKKVNLKDLEAAKAAIPEALVLVHPECTPGIVEKADFVGSTDQIIKYATESKHKIFLIGTEQGVLYPLKNKNPDKTFFILSPKLICPNMKKTRLSDVLSCLHNMNNEIVLSREIIEKAHNALDRMINTK